MTDYEWTRRSFRWDRREQFNFGTHVVDRWAAEAPESEALFWVGETAREEHVTYGRLARRSDQVANSLQQWGSSEVIGSWWFCRACRSRQ